MTNPIAVEWFVEDGFVVAGTLDPHVALAAAVADDDEFRVRYSAVEMGERSLDADDEPSAEAVAELGDALHQFIAEAVASRWHWFPASEEDREDYGVTRWLRLGDGLDSFEGVAFR
ncbi:hypothetical protein VA596_50000 [Amycolatopsis sp., V23-08]|uniref:Uncharacterized protein n=1 Tax=Amycolatopsis heterodermiae TaxID=3110235 RepID=A0ABU5RP85_9PSEU|nr:hypothetical protein [Amycolatopsis sp., V23-08]MEA5367745.1 hypothetical protein [Amycolatopsis sp., V23-08]